MILVTDINLPSSDPQVVGAIWKNAAGMLFVSAGPVTAPPPPPPPPPTSSHFIASENLGTPGTSPYGNPSYLGMSITVGASNLLVTALGRWDLSGNNLTHNLAIFDAASQLQVGPTLSVHLTGTGAFVYASYASGVVLQAGRAYYIVSTEQGYDPADTLYLTDSTYTTAADATLNGAVLQGNQNPQFSNWQLTPGKTTFGPVDFQYSTTSAPATLPGSPWSLYEHLGMDQASVGGWCDHASTESYILAQPEVTGANVIYRTRRMTACRGSVSLALEAFMYNAQTTPADTVTGQWRLDGSTIISPALSADITLVGQAPFVWDTTKTTDGTHVITFEIIDAKNAPAAIYKSVPICVIVGNAGFSTGAQNVALSTTFSMWMPSTPEFVKFNGTPNPHLNTVPFTPVACPSANGAVVTLTQEAVAEPLNPSTGAAEVYTSGPRWITSPAGQGIFPVGNAWNGIANSLDADGSNFDSIMPVLGMDGARLDNLSHGFTTFVDALDGSGWWGLSLDGRLFKRTFSGAITTVAGRALNRQNFNWDNNDPALFEPATISGADTTLNTRAVIVGNWAATPGGNNGGWYLKNGTDLCVDPRNHSIVYVVLQVPGVILKIDTSTSPATITPYAGTLQSDHTNVNGVGYADGPVATAKFSEPSSIIMSDGSGKAGPVGTMYVADFNNGAVREINPGGTAVTTVAGGTFSSQPPPTNPIYAPSAAGTVPTKTNFIAYPYWMRFTSTGTIVLVESYSLTVRELDLSAGTLRHIGTFQGGTWQLSGAVWTALDVDSKGTIGPVDRIYEAFTQGDVPMEFIDLNGGNRSTWLGIGSQEIEKASGQLIGAGYFPWMFAIHRTQCRAIATFLDDGPITYELRGPPYGTDTVAASTQSDYHDFNALVRGWINFRYGTCGIWFPYNSRPSFLALYGDTGQSRLGLSTTNLTFDEIDANFPSSAPGDAGDIALANFIRAGMIGTVPRPEITGNDMRDLIFYIRRNTLRGGQPNPAASAPSVVPGPDDPDTGNHPLITAVAATRNSATSITVTWTTDKPTIGLAGGTTPTQAAQGQLMRYGVFSPIESAFGTSHSVTISGLPEVSPTHYVAVSKDYAGNCSYSPDQAIT